MEVISFASCNELFKYITARARLLTLEDRGNTTITYDILTGSVHSTYIYSVQELLDLTKLKLV